MENKTFTKALGDFKVNLDGRFLRLYGLMLLGLVVAIVIFDTLTPYWFFSSFVAFASHMIFIFASMTGLAFLVVNIEESRKYTIFTDTDKLFLEEMPSEKPYAYDSLAFKDLNDIVVSSDGAVYRLHELVNFEKSTFDRNNNLVKVRKYKERITNDSPSRVLEFLYLPVTFEVPNGAYVDKIIKQDNTSVDNQVYIDECEQISPKLTLNELKKRIDMLSEYREVRIKKDLENIQQSERERITQATINRDLPYNNSLKNFKDLTEEELNNTHENINDTLERLHK